MSFETLSAPPAHVDPVFDPERIGASLDAVNARLLPSAHMLRGSIIGDTTSKRRGQGYDFDGVRPYEYGDDPRHIDHYVTARQPDLWPQIRERYADIHPAVWVVTDSLQSRQASNPGYFSEQQLGISAALTCMQLAQAGGMPSATITANDVRTRQQPEPAQGRPHLLNTARGFAQDMSQASAERNKATQPVTANRILQLLRSTASDLPKNPAELKPDRPTFGELLQFASKTCLESIVVVVSDFRDAAPSHEQRGWQTGLERLAGQGNEVIAIEVTNAWDYELPETVDRLATDTGVIWIGNDKRGQKIRDDYRQKATTQQAQIDHTLARAGAHHIKLSTDEPRWMQSFCTQLKR